MTDKKNEKQSAQKPDLRKRLRMAAAVAVLVGLVGVGMLGYRWIMTVPFERIEFAGVQHADSSALMELARVDTGLVLMEIDPDLIADRVRRHPWVGEAAAMRLPNGTLRIDVQERVPVVLVLDREGQPSHYLDRDGYAMPLVPGAFYDVPLLRGLKERYHPVRQLQEEGVRALLGFLAVQHVETDALISEFDIQPSGEVWLYTVPAGEHGAIQVRLGRDGFAEKLERLSAFWYQAILTRPNKVFNVIDLRFDGQIVTQEETVGGQLSAADL